MRLLVTALFLLSTTAAAAQQAAPPAQAEKFEPKSGQAGKDVVWVPSPPDMVNKLMELGNVTRNDFVIDLGSGDGRNIIAAAKLGVADKAQFFEGDMYEYDISKATVMALFLLPVNMNRLAPKFFNLAPGSRIVANTFGIDGWEPDERVTLPVASECESWCEALLWIVPAKVGGTWTMGGDRMTLTQEYQAVQGNVTIGGSTYPVVMGRLRGEEIVFVATGMPYKGRVKGNTIEGTTTTPKGDIPWRATRQ
jgi:hypothetical protein